MAKVNISINDDLLKRVDDVAEKNYLSRSGLISQATQQYITSLELSETLKDLSLTLRTISNQGFMSKDDEKKLERVETLCQLLQ